MRKLLRGAVAACLALPLFLALSPSAQAAPNPLTTTSGFYVDPNSSPTAWATANPGDGRASAIRNSIANVPAARWFGSWSGDIGSATNSFAGAAESANKLPILVAYNIYGRDACGGQSSGGAASPSEYARWIGAFASGIGSRPAVVILEPDSLGDYSCMSQDKINERQNMIINALSQFRSKAPNANVLPPNSRNAGGHSNTSLSARAGSATSHAPRSSSTQPGNDLHSEKTSRRPDANSPAGQSGCTPLILASDSGSRSDRGRALC